MVAAAIGFTIYPGSDAAFDMFEEIREMSAEAKSCGLPTVIWSYPRGGDLSKIGETAVDICTYAAHSLAFALILSKLNHQLKPLKILMQLKFMKSYLLSQL